MYSAPSILGGSADRPTYGLDWRLIRDPSPLQRKPSSRHRLKSKRLPQSHSHPPTRTAAGSSTMWSAATAAAAARAVSVSPLPAPSLRRGGPRGGRGSVSVRSTVWDFVGGDLVRPDLGKWLDDVEKHKALAIYPPHEGGYEGRYLNRLRYQGYYFLDLSARGLGDPETTLTKVHPVCPPSLGRQPVARWYFPPEVDYRLSLLHPDAKGLVVWIIEAKVLSKAELQFLAMLPDIRPKVRVIAECGNWRSFVWKPLKQIAGLEPDPDAED